MMSATAGRLLARLVAVFLVVGVGLAFLITGSTARADTIIRGGITPSAVAVDRSGHVFIADAPNNRVVVDKPNGSGSYTQSVVDGTGLYYPEGVAVDGSGDVFIADTGNNRVVVDKPNGSGGYTRSVVDDSGLVEPAAVAVGGSGDVFIADTGNNRVVVDRPNGSGGYTQSVVDNGLSRPSGVAVDGSGDVFIADAGNNRVVVDRPNGSGGYTQSDIGLSGSLGVAVDGSGDVFVFDATQGGVVVDRPDGSGGYIQSVVDAGVSDPAGLAVDGSGDVFIADADGSRVLVEKPNGSGYTQSVVDAGVSDPAGVAVDRSGDVFIADSNNNRVLVEKPNSSGGYSESVVSAGLSYPRGVAVDRSGNVFIADTGNDRVVVDKPNSSGGYTQSVVSVGLSNPGGVAVDAAGDVYIADTSHSQVLVDKPNSSGGYTQSVVDDSGLSIPFGVAVDGSGDVFIADTGHSRVLVDKPNISGGYIQSVVDDSGLSELFGVAVDAAGDVYIADTGHNQVLVDKPDGSGGYTQSVVDSGLRNPGGVAVDGSGDVFIADTGHNRVVEHGMATPLADFTSAQRAGTLTVAFTDASIESGLATITGWSWNFGDGSPSSTQQNPSHSYPSTGSFTVSLTVTDSNGQTATFTQLVEVASVHASLTYPTLGLTGVSTILPFSWTDIPAGQGYQLWIGTRLGDGRLSKSGVLSASTSSYKVPVLPTGVRLWARLYTEVAGSWSDTEDISFTASGNRVAFTYPTAGSQQNINTITPFSWSPATGAQAYQLTIGTKPGVADLVNSGILASNVTSYREPALPTGKTLYAKIVAKINSSWTDYQAISFPAAPNPVAFTNPTQGQTGVSTPTTFTWNTTPAATGYQMWIGTRRGDGSLLKSGWLRPGTSSYEVPALPAGRTLYARIYTGVASGWGNYQDITFSTPSTESLSATATANRAITNQLNATAAHQPTPAWMRRLLRLEPDLR